MGDSAAWNWRLSTSVMLVYLVLFIELHNISISTEYDLYYLLTMLMLPTLRLFSFLSKLYVAKPVYFLIFLCYKTLIIERIVMVLLQLCVPEQVLCSKPQAHQSPPARLYLLFLNSQWQDWQTV